MQHSWRERWNDMKQLGLDAASDWAEEMLSNWFSETTRTISDDDLDYTHNL